MARVTIPDEGIKLRIERLLISYQIKIVIILTPPIKLVIIVFEYLEILKFSVNF